jgi:hypothetical protein
VELSLTVDRTKVSPDEQLMLDLNISGSDSGSVSEPEIEGIENFEILGRSSGTQLYLSGLKLTSSKSYSYTLRPLTTGVTATLRAVVKEGNKEYSSNVVEVELVKSSGKRAPSPHPPPGGLFGLDDPFFRGSGRGSYREDDFLLQADVNPRTIYVGQELIYRLSFYRVVNLWSSPKFSLPDTKGFWKVRLPQSERRKTLMRRVGGRQYMVTEITMLLYPLSAGRSTIGQGAVHFQPEPFSTELHLRSDSVDIEVLPLPEEGKPADFTGLVGSFSINAWLKELSAKEGEPVTLTVSVSGGGNLHNIQRPVQPSLKGFEVYEPETGDEFSLAAKGNNGYRNFSYILVPEKSGRHLIGEFVSNYFDPEKREYRRIATKEMTLEVKGAAKPAPTPGHEPRREVEKLSTGIKHIKPDVTELKEEGRPYYLRPLFYLYPAAVLLMFFIYNFYITRRRRLASDTGYIRSVNARRLAEKRLKRAARLIDEGSEDLFFGEMARGLRQFLADKRNIEEAGLTTEEIAEILMTVNGASGLDKRFSMLLQECNRARFAPGEHEKGEMKKLLKEAFSIIKELEKRL